MPRHPLPQGKYVPAKRHGNLVYTAGMTPRDNGQLILAGPVQMARPLDDYRAAAELAAANALAAAQATLNAGERLDAIITMTVYVAAEQGFEAHSRIADFASEYLVEALGDAAVCSRAAVGVYSLPGGAPLEIALVAAVGE